MHILHISDIHCSYNAIQRLAREVIPSIHDRLLGVFITGDIECPELVIDPLLEILREGSQRIFAVTGNMDDTYVARYLQERRLSVEGNIIIHGKYAIGGVSGIEPYVSLRILSERLKKVSQEKRDLDLIILSHFPPFNTKVDIAWGNVHAGLPELRDFITSYNPRIFLCGHIHESRGVDNIGDTLIVNAGSIAEGNYALIDIKNKKAELARLW